MCLANIRLARCCLALLRAAALAVFAVTYLLQIAWPFNSVNVSPSVSRPRSVPV